MSVPRQLGVSVGLAEIEAGRLSAAEWFDACASAPDPLGAYLWRAEPGSGGPRPDRAGPGGDATGGEPTTGGSSAGGLAGVPIAVKDIFCIEGVPTTAGSRVLGGYVPPYTATAVEGLLAAGASVLGKTNMDEFAMGSSNENSAFGPARNPWDPERVPGGSSGGSAAAVAAGLAPAALGTDTGGSIRQPAALCGVVGMKPTYGAVSRSGMIAFASSLDQCGPLTRNVRDAALVLRAVVGRDRRDSTSLELPGPVELPSREDLKGLRIGVPKELAADARGIERGVGETFQRTLARCEELGAEVAETELPHASYALSAYYVIAPAEASANLSRFDGVRYGLREPADELDAMYEATRSTGFGPEVKRRVMLGTFALSSGYYDAYYGRAQRVRTLIARDFAAAFERFDLLLTPTSPTVAFKLGERAEDPLAMYMSDYCTAPMSLAGLPAISIPAGLAEPDGGGPELPVGVQLAGPAFSESLLLDAAGALESAIGFGERPRIPEEEEEA